MQLAGRFVMVWCWAGQSVENKDVSGQAVGGGETTHWPVN
jgi:hypothetical protein